MLENFMWFASIASIIIVLYFSLKIFQFHARCVVNEMILFHHRETKKFVVLSEIEKRNLKEFLEKWSNPVNMIAVGIAFLIHSIMVLLYPTLTYDEMTTGELILSGLSFGCTMFILITHSSLDWDKINDITKDVALAHYRGYKNWLQGLLDGTGNPDDIRAIMTQTSADLELVKIWIAEQIEIADGNISRISNWQR